MRYIDCDNCGTKYISLNETIKIDSKVYCNNCFQSNFADTNSLADKTVVKELDPTICASCSKDFGLVELKKISSYPVCGDCEVKIKNRTFPTWVKAFLAAIVIIVVVSFIWNWKYYTAYNDIQESYKSMNKDDVAAAVRLMNSAIEKVPEASDLKVLAAYFQGIEYLKNDRSADALIEFYKCRDKVTPDFDIDALIVQARIGAAFDRKDYQGFLDATQENLARDSSSAIALTSVASAYACIFADKGDEGARQNALLYLNRARMIDSTSDEMKDYYNKVEYRISSRKIISRKEFDKQFPNGWTQN